MSKVRLKWGLGFLVLVSSMVLIAAVPVPKGKEPTKTFKAKQKIGRSFVARDKSAVFVCAVTIPKSPSGTVYEQGAGGYGSWVGFTQNGDLHVHAGKGSGFDNPQAAHFTLPAAKVPKGKGTLAWKVDIAKNAVEMWWNAKLLGDAKSPQGFSRWAGTNPGGYGVAYHVVSGGLDKPFNGELHGPLAYYRLGDAGKKKNTKK